MSEPLDTNAHFNELASVAFWKKHFPKLTIGSLLAAWDRDAGQLPSDTRRFYTERMAEEGYFGDRSATLAATVPFLAEAAEKCRQLGLPPVFIFLFDEAWKCFWSLQPVLKHVLGDGFMALPDFWVWYVDPKSNEAGWRPHRDKGRISLGPNREPLSLSVWVPLVEVTPENSCIYLLPINRDPTYGTADEDNVRYDLPQFRALPGRPGDFFCWNQSVFHWGSASSRFAGHPRISMAVEFQRGDRPPFNGPLIRPFANLAFNARLMLVGKQILQYKHMYPLNPALEQLAHRLIALNHPR